MNTITKIENRLDTILSMPLDFLNRKVDWLEDKFANNRPVNWDIRRMKSIPQKVYTLPTGVHLDTKVQGTRDAIDRWIEDHSQMLEFKYFSVPDPRGIMVTLLPYVILGVTIYYLI